MRSLEAGHPVPTAIALVGRELPDPIGSEFGMAADEIAYGAHAGAGGGQTSPTAAAIRTSTSSPPPSACRTARAAT